MSFITNPSTSPYVLAGTHAGHVATGIWDGSSDAAAATVVFTELSGKSEILIICDAVTLSAVGIPYIQVSDDNGSTWYTASGNYVGVATTGVETNSTTGPAMTDTAATAARTSACRLEGANLPITARPILVNDRLNPAFFKGSTNAINAIRVGNTGAGNFNGGKIYCLAK